MPRSIDRFENLVFVFHFYIKKTFRHLHVFRLFFVQSLCHTTLPATRRTPRAMDGIYDAYIQRDGVGKPYRALVTDQDLTDVPTFDEATRRLSPDVGFSPPYVQLARRRDQFVFVHKNDEGMWQECVYCIDPTMQAAFRAAMTDNFAKRVFRNAELETRFEDTKRALEKAQKETEDARSATSAATAEVQRLRDVIADISRRLGKLADPFAQS